VNIKIGDSVHSCFGIAKIEGMTLTTGPFDKDGDPVSVVGIESVKAGKVVFDLSNGHWAYSNQITAINNVSVSRLNNQ
jgi:hypothetical protein